MNGRLVAQWKFSILCLIGLLVLPWTAPASAGVWEWATGPSIYDEEGKRDWSIEITPYLWLANLNGDIGLPPVGTIPVNLTFSQLADNLDAGFAGVMDVRYRRWHMLVDGSWVRLKGTAEPPQPALLASSVDVAVAFGLAGIAYELPLDWGVSIQPYLAARWWHLKVNTLVTTVGPTLGGGATEVWADAIFGTRIRYAIADKWQVGLTGDIGAGNANLDWQVLGVLSYMFNPHIGMTAGYRILGVDYSRQGFVYKVKQNGLILGLNLAY
jgi:hypothetical protein